jgi:hypothetical protein
LLTRIRVGYAELGVANPECEQQAVAYNIVAPPNIFARAYLVGSANVAVFAPLKFPKTQKSRKCKSNFSYKLATLWQIIISVVKQNIPFTAIL